MTKVYILVVDDDNVCCPSTETLGVFSSRQSAEAWRDYHLSHESKAFGRLYRNDYNIIEWTLDDPEAP